MIPFTSYQQLSELCLTAGSRGSASARYAITATGSKKKNPHDKNNLVPGFHFLILHNAKTPMQANDTPSMRNPAGSSGTTSKRFVDADVPKKLSPLMCDDSLLQSGSISHVSQTTCGT